MRYVTELHRRFESGGVPFVYVSPSASILALDAVSTGVLDHFTGGADLDEWVATEGGEEEFVERTERIPRQPGEKDSSYDRWLDLNPEMKAKADMLLKRPRFFIGARVRAKMKMK